MRLRGDEVQDLGRAQRSGDTGGRGRWVAATSNAEQCAMVFFMVLSFSLLILYQSQSR